MNKPTITDSKILSQVIIHAATQRCKSVDYQKRCLYRQDRTPECKIRCFAGIFIADEDYNLEVEGTVHRANTFGVFKYDFSDNQLSLLADYQKIHDHQPVQEWHNYLWAEADLVPISEEATAALQTLKSLGVATN